MKQVWVKITERDRYGASNGDKWELGTIVGEQTLRRIRDHVTLEQQLTNTSCIEKRYLVETRLETVEAWASETYGPAEEPAK